MEQNKARVAMVTGASRGIGQAIAKELASQGYYVLGTSTSESGAAQISTMLAAQGQGLVLNQTDANAIEQMVERLAEEHKAPEILVNNAGVTADNLLLRMSDEEWDKVIDTNLNGVFRLTRACLKSMFRARYGRIINISSVVGFTGNSGQANYAATKAALIGFSRSLAQEMASRGITVNVVAPGFIQTDMTEVLPDMVKAELLKRIPMKRLGQVDDIAKAVAFLVSDSAAYMTGQTLHVNGGMYMA